MRTYVGRQLDQIAFPLGGIGAGTICLQGTGALGNIAIWNKPNYNFSPMMFSAITIKGEHNVSRVVEAPVPDVNIFARHHNSALGLGEYAYGLPRFEAGVFSARFPFAQVDLRDSRMPVEARITGWSPSCREPKMISSLPSQAGISFENQP